jgi:iron uptake system EfeUOB component EfeO/EfeM
LPRRQKAHRVGGAYAGLALDGLRSKRRHKILTDFGKVNAVLARYTLNSFDDYDRIEDEDLREILRIVRSLTPPK